jgi:sugar phosphate isomerase/epimerase
MRRKLSVGTWAFCFGPYVDNPIELDIVLEGVARMGFDGVSLGGFKPHAHPDLYPTYSDRKKLVKKINDCGLEVAEYGADLWSLDSLGDRNAYIDLFTKYLQMAADCGFSMIRVDTGHPPIIPLNMNYQEVKNTIIEIFQQFCELAQPYGITIVWEFEPGFFFNKPSEIMNIYSWVNRDNFMYLLDTCHAHMCASVGARQLGETETLEDGAYELIGLLKGKIKIVHLIDSDNTLHDADTSTHAPLGSGVLDFPKIIKALEKADYEGPWFALDLCFWPNAWDIVKESKTFMDRLFE